MMLMANYGDKVPADAIALLVVAGPAHDPARANPGGGGLIA
jgi:hypothetical protein